LRIIFFANTSWNLYNFRLHLIQTLVLAGHEIHLISPEDQFTKYLINAGFQWHAFPISRKGMNPIEEIKTIRAISTIYKQIQPDAAFHFTPKCVLYGSIVARNLRTPIIINTISGLGYLFSSARMRLLPLREVVHLFYQFSMVGSKVIFQNPEDLKEFLNRRIIRKEQAFLVRGSGVDMERFIFTKEKNGIPIVILPARLIKEKGALEFVEAARLIKSRKIKARFILVGQIDDENPSAIPVDQINHWVEEGLVEWWGWRSDMEKVYQRCHLVCLPTYYREGTPKSLIEAAACGRAIIASNIPGCKEIVRNNLNGILIKPKSSVVLAHAIQKLLLDPDLRKQMGLEGRKIVEKEFHNRLITTEIIKVAGI
jgi:glycosyltransferase involved in cell wall biosynthesis